MPRPWLFQPHQPAAIAQLSQQLRLSPLVAQVLIARGFQSAEIARTFLSARLADLFDPSRLPGVDQAADRILTAIADQRRITIYGDYDVDGVTATSVLWHCLSLAGATVDYYIPCRMEEGYGLNTDAIRQLHEEDADRLLISVDCGIASLEEAAIAQELGLELIITDHHHIGPELPSASCLVHPRLPDTDYPFGDLCGVGVAFKLAWAICQRLGDGRKASPRMREFLKSAVGLTAIGTVADVVPLLQENRVIVRYGLNSMKENPSLGLKALMTVSKLDEKPQLTAEDIGFGLAPRLNAAGRLGQARLAVELLTTSDPERAASLADYVDQLNNNRKTVERRIFKAAREMVDQKSEWEEHPTLVLADHGWHPGVIGIVASRVAELYEKPTVLIALRDDGTGQGSARSWAGFDLYSGIAACQDYLLGFGGHKVAAGIQIDAGRIDEFRTALANWTATHHSVQESDVALRVDAEVLLSEVTRRAVQELNHLGPFGEANPAPRFSATNVELVDPPRTMGEGDRHLSLRIRQHKTVMRAVAFGRGEWAEEIAAVNGRLSVYFAPVINSFRGFERVELRLIDWKPAT
ncbi:MAG: single-stranded-DNA-specific exonuclease RecJ [Fuerstiella sp.]|nr:single-stranded-DNA-specific exonuclease RecJ [Fuerstiella sp.]